LQLSACREKMGSHIEESNTGSTDRTTELPAYIGLASDTTHESNDHGTDCRVAQCQIVLLINKSCCSEQGALTSLSLQAIRMRFKVAVQFRTSPKATDPRRWIRSNARISRSGLHCQCTNKAHADRALLNNLRPLPVHMTC